MLRNCLGKCKEFIGDNVIIIINKRDRKIFSELTLISKLINISCLLHLSPTNTLQYHKQTLN